MLKPQKGSWCFSPFRWFFHSCFFNKKMVIRKSQDNSNQPCFLFQRFLCAVLCFVHVYLSIIVLPWTLDIQTPAFGKVFVYHLFTRKKNTCSHLLQKVWFGCLGESTNGSGDPWGLGGPSQLFYTPHVKEPLKKGYLGGETSIIFGIFTPKNWGRFLPILTSIMFQRGWWKTSD